MKNWIAFTLFLIFCRPASAQQAAELPLDSLYKWALTDLPAFSRYVARDAASDFEKADRITAWFARNFDWTATDYKKRTVQEIVQRRGGNCSELAMVTRAALDALGLKMRRVREINLHVLTPRRQETAEKKVAESGFSSSVFGKQHNDHVWLEIYDAATGAWFPADPSIGVVGQRAWMAARYSFGKRYSLNPVSADMIAPFAVFAEDGTTWVNRSAYYAVEGFNGFYFGQLAALPAWNRWIQGIENLDDKALGAFQGKINLHQHSADIASLAATYEQLKKEFQATDLGRIFQNIDAFSASLVAQDFEKVVASYTADGKIFPDRRPVLEGPGPIAKYWTPAPDAKYKTSHHRVMPEEIKVIGNEAYDWGYYEGKTAGPDGKETSWRGKYVIVWKKTETGEWKIYLDIWNRMP